MRWRIIVGLLAWGAVFSSAETPVDWRDKVDPAVFERALATQDWTTEILVVLEEQADLTAADSLRGKPAKGRFVVERLRETADRTQPPVLDLLRRGGISHRSFWVANVVWAKADLLMIESLARLGTVRRIHANPSVRMDLPVLQHELRGPTAVEWNILKINATGVWARGITGEGVVIGGQDTGYSWEHPALKSKYRGYDGITTNHNYNWHDAIHSGGGGCGADSPFPCDDYDHGTHTMGTMVGDDGGANQIGVAPGARWIGCRNMNQGVGSPASYTECFEWFLAPTDLNGLNPDPERAPDIINNSWGCWPSEGCTDVNILKTVVQNTRAAGILVVASAGNAGSSCGSINDPPAIYEESFTVGNTTSSDEISGSSSRGAVTVDGSSRLKPNISAPGTSIRSSVPGDGYGNMSGTSMAGPHIAGVAALILSAHPGLRGEVDLLETLMEQTAVRLTSAQECGGIAGTNIPNNTFGWGRVDAFEAVGLDDSDDDGLPNWWEVVFGFDRFDPADAVLDADGDTFLNIQEFLGNTDPANGLSFLRLTEIRRHTNGALATTWATGQEGLDAPRTYQLYHALPALEGPWGLVASNLAPTGACTTLELPATNAGFYRVTVARTTNAIQGLDRSVRP